MIFFTHQNDNKLMSRVKLIMKMRNWVENTRYTKPHNFVSGRLFTLKIGILHVLVPPYNMKQVSN